VTSDAKLFAIVFEGNSHTAFFRSKISAPSHPDCIKRQLTAAMRNVSESSKFPMHQNGTA
jgi:hypothetical protein